MGTCGACPSSGASAGQNDRYPRLLHDGPRVKGLLFLPAAYGFGLGLELTVDVPHRVNDPLRAVPFDQDTKRSGRWGIDTIIVLEMSHYIFNIFFQQDN